MGKPISELIQQYKALNKRIAQFNEAVAMMSWDLQTSSPPKSVGYRSETMSVMSTEAFKLSVSDEMGQLLEELSKPENQKELDMVLKTSIEEDMKKYLRFKKIPTSKYQEYTELVNKTQGIWQEAKSKQDFSILQPNLEKIIDYKRQLVQLWGYEGHPYNPLLDQYEAGMTVEKLDEVFEYLKEKLVPFFMKIKGSGYNPDESMFLKSFDADNQRKLSNKVLNKLGFDFERGKVGESPHPFCSKINPGDIRITTKYDEMKFKSALFATIHECGHAIYEQNVSNDLMYTPLFSGASAGIHESQSRFWENMLGRSLEFWNYFIAEVLETFPDQLENVTIEEIYHGINKVEGSLIRIYADELTYNMHIILRYELEKQLITGEIQVGDLPRLWNEKMKEYLDIVPANDGEGVLQDIHWSWGLFGYFPTYSLGNIYAAQFFEKLKTDLPNYHELVQKGKFKEIKEWFVEKIHRHGKMLSPAELVKEVTGEEINPKYLVDYIINKYSAIYGLK